MKWVVPHSIHSPSIVTTFSFILHPFPGFGCTMVSLSLSLSLSSKEAEAALRLYFP
jgi:hypothetical protein